MIHELKILPEFYEAVQAKIKPFEIRKNDRGFKVDDLLLLQEYENDDYTGRVIHARVTYITGYAQRKNYVVMGIELM